MCVRVKVLNLFNSKSIDTLIEFWIFFSRFFEYIDRLIAKGILWLAVFLSGILFLGVLYALRFCCIIFSM